MELKIAHISLNVFQSDAKRESDIRKVFARGNHIITGTEAGTGKNNHGTAILRRVEGSFWRASIRARDRGRGDWRSLSRFFGVSLDVALPAA